MKILVFCAVSLVISTGSATNYCNKDLCPTGRHIACNNFGYYSQRCPSDRRMIDVRRSKGYFTHAHNKYRNLIASGHLPGYEPAARMATMVWDDELAKLAELNVKTCIFEHDDCYHTERFRNAGQCLAGLYYYKGSSLNLTDIIEQAVGGWFSEHVNADMSYIKHFRVDSNFLQYGHFTEFVVDRNTHVGCAVIEFTDKAYPDWYRLNVACNYASVHSGEFPVYQAGYPASKCNTGRNPRYPALCSVKEKINPNYYF